MSTANIRLMSVTLHIGDAIELSEILDTVPGPTSDKTWRASRWTTPPPATCPGS